MMCFSKIDTKTPITEEEWAVTVVRYTAPKTNHAQIIIEGIKDKNQFMKLAHLTATHCGLNRETTEHGHTCVFSKKGKVKIEVLTGKHREYPERTPTWPRSREKVELMWTKIELESVADENEDIDNLQEFTYWGDKSIFTHGSKKIKVTHPDLLDLKEKDPVVFRSVCEEALDPNFHNKIAAKWLITAGGPIAFIPVVNLITLPISFGCFALYLRWAHGISRFDEDERKRLNILAKEHIKEHTVPANNCFSWVRGKTSMVDVVLPDNFFDLFITVPSLHIPKAPK